MTCNRTCSKYIATKPRTGGRYGAGQKRCQICEEYLQYEGLFCPCCGYRLRTKPRNGFNKAKLRESKENPIESLERVDL